MDLVLFDPFQTKAVPMEDGKTLVEVATWFDNETSYISHFMKLAELLGAGSTPSTPTRGRTRRPRGA